MGRSRSRSPPKEVRTFGSQEYLLEEAIVTDFGLF
jgi:hypothetical protein